jgi:E1A/CREB-binding protein
MQRVYISLLDSVKMPKMVLPSKLRTHMYHTMLRGYLRWAAQRGFTHAHIFTCPPRRGQNYIFPFKPDFQRETCVTRLRAW